MTECLASEIIEARERTASRQNQTTQTDITVFKRSPSKKTRLNISFIVNTSYSFMIFFYISTNGKMNLKGKPKKKPKQKNIPYR